MPFMSFALSNRKPSRWAMRNSREAQMLPSAVSDASLLANRHHQETQLETIGAKVQFTLTGL